MSYVTCPKCGAAYENGFPPIEVSVPGWCLCPRPLPILGTIRDIELPYSHLFPSPEISWRNS
jgi:hypothetical protein